MHCKRYVVQVPGQDVMQNVFAGGVHHYFETRFMFLVTILGVVQQITKKQDLTTWI